MQNFLNKVGKTASAAANKAGNKASELIEIGKLKAKVSSEKQQMEDAKQAIGEYYYDLFKADKAVDDNIKDYCEKIKASEDAIAELEQQIDAVKED